MSRWDWDLPASKTEVVALLRRRIEIHLIWADYMARDSAGAQAAAGAGVGTEASHRTYAAQYEAAIRVLECS